MAEEQSITIWVAFGAGLLSFLSPCVLPLIPSYITFVTGISLKELKEEHKSKTMIQKMVINSIAFILGFSFVFISLGASASFMGELLSTYKFWITRIGGSIIIVLGLFITGLIKIKPLSYGKKFELKKKPFGILGSFVVGIVFAAGWTPCVGPILGSVLLLAGTEASLYKGILLLTAYSLGLGIPFFISTIAIGLLLSASKKINKYLQIVSVFSGVLLIAIGILMVTGKFNQFIYALTS